jgi:hypothetical protein
MSQLKIDNENYKGGLIKRWAPEFPLAIVESADVFRAWRLPDVGDSFEVISKIIPSTWKTKISTLKKS